MLCPAIVVMHACGFCGTTCSLSMARDQALHASSAPHMAQANSTIRQLSTANAEHATLAQYR
eukprot:3941960-Rhodomonas_salina.5